MRKCHMGNSSGVVFGKGLTHFSERFRDDSTPATDGKRIMQVEKIKKIYAKYSDSYDLIFKKLFQPRIAEVISKMDIKPGKRVLEVGVGTGLSFPFYPRHCQVIGVDLSLDMLKKAQEKINQNKFSHIQLQEMDASFLGFEDNCFDFVLAAFVISVVPDPIKVVSEIKRVSKANAKIAIVNHFKSQNKFVGILEDMVNPVCTRIGWKSNVELEYIIEKSNLKVDNITKWKKNDLWTMVFAVNSE